VLHSWWGLNGFFREVCDRLAAEGFVALAPDLYGGKVATTPAAARRLRASATTRRREPVYRFLMRKIEFLKRHEAVTGSAIGQLGFSMGGHWALWLSQQEELPLAATVAFYAARGGDYSRTRSSFLCHFAEDDDWVSASAVKKLVRQLDAAGVSSTIHQYPGTRHWFFESDRTDSFEPRAAELAWKRTLRFLGASLPTSHGRRRD
jgi:carboxymethylenebutenolidase